MRRLLRLLLSNKAFTGVLLLVAIGLPVAAGVSLEVVDERWTLTDWVALIAGVWTSFWFLVLAAVLGVAGQRRATAVADAEISRSMGALALAGSRAFAGANRQALTIPFDALAALEHYEVAGPKEQLALLASIQSAVTDTIFGPICRADSLPRSMWDQLAGGMRQLDSHLLELTRTEPHPDRRSALWGLQGLTELCLELGSTLREKHWEVGRGGGAVDLSQVMEGGSDAPAGETGSSSLRLLRRLYAKELAVVVDWDVLLRRRGPEVAAPQVQVRVSLEAVECAREWYAPWYVVRDDDSRRDTHARAVNVNRRELTEAAHQDVVRAAPHVPEWPMPLKHGQVPDDMREYGVLRTMSLLEHQPQPVTVCVLLYELAPHDGEQQGERIVLDGNHRLAAALRMADRDKAARTREMPRVLAFVIKENEPIADPVRMRPWAHLPDEWNWCGFTPDVQNLRSGPDDDDDDASLLLARQPDQPS